MMGLRVAGKVTVPLAEFDNEEFRYEHRFMPFRVVMTPPPVHYEQFLLMTDLSNYPKVCGASIARSSLVRLGRRLLFRWERFFLLRVGKPVFLSTCQVAWLVLA